MPTTTATDTLNLLDTLIVGAGISGLSLGYALQQDRWLLSATAADKCVGVCSSGDGCPVVGAVGEETVAQFFGRHLGLEVLERLVAPFVFMCLCG